MTVQIEEAPLRARVLDIADAPASQRQRLAGDLVTHLIDTEVIEVWARSLAKRYVRPDDYEEFIQVMCEAILGRLHEIQPEEVDAIASLTKHLFYCCKRAVTVYIDSPAVTVAQGMSGASRRYREAQGHRAEFVRERQYDPTDAELVDYINQKVTATRANAAKQGALVTIDDVSGAMLKPYSMDYRSAPGDDGVDDASMGTPTDGDVDASAMVAITAQQLGALADEMYGTDGDPAVRDVLDAWMGFVAAGERPTVVGIAGHFGISRGQAQKQTERLEAVLEAFRSR